MITEDDLDCSRVTFINMDEFLDDDGGWIDPGHPLSTTPQRKGSELTIRRNGDDS
jgi:hypothetical protein